MTALSACIQGMRHSQARRHALIEMEQSMRRDPKKASSALWVIYAAEMQELGNREAMIRLTLMDIEAANDGPPELRMG